MGGFFCGALRKVTGRPWDVPPGMLTPRPMGEADAGAEVNISGLGKRDEAIQMGTIGFKGYIDGQYFEGNGSLNVRSYLLISSILRALLTATRRLWPNSKLCTLAFSTTTPLLIPSLDTPLRLCKHVKAPRYVPHSIAPAK